MGRENLIRLLMFGLFVIATNANLLATEYIVTNSSEFNALSLNPGDVVILKMGYGKTPSLNLKELEQIVSPLP